MAQWFRATLFGSSATGSVTIDYTNKDKVDNAAFWASAFGHGNYSSSTDLIEENDDSSTQSEVSSSQNPSTGNYSAGMRVTAGPSMFFAYASGVTSNVPCYRGFIQAQGANPPVQESESWSRGEGEWPLTREEGAQMLDKVFRKLARSERRERREAYNRARRWIMKSPPEGRYPSGEDVNFFDPQRHDDRARIDIHIIKGVAFGDRNKMRHDPNCGPV